MSDFFCFYLMLSDTIELKLRRILKMKQVRNQEKQSAPCWGRPFQVRATPAPSPTYITPPQQVAPVSAPSPEDLMDRDSWQVDEHWVAVASYVAEMNFPNEG